MEDTWPQPSSESAVALAPPPIPARPERERSGGPREGPISVMNGDRELGASRFSGDIPTALQPGPPSLLPPHHDS